MVEGPEIERLSWGISPECRWRIRAPRDESTVCDSRNGRPSPRLAPVSPDPGVAGALWLSGRGLGPPSGGAGAAARAGRAGGRRPAPGPRAAAPVGLRGPGADVREARAAPEHAARPPPRSLHDRAGGAA